MTTSKLIHQAGIAKPIHAFALSRLIMRHADDVVVVGVVVNRESQHEREVLLTLNVRRTQSWIGGGMQTCASALQVS
jgi:hypothetical protein